MNITSRKSHLAYFTRDIRWCATDVISHSLIFKKSVKGKLNTKYLLLVKLLCEPTVDTSWFPLFRTAKISWPFQYFYRPPRSCGKVIFNVRKGSCGKVMFLHLSLSHSVHGGGGGVVVSASVHAGIHPPRQTPTCMLGYTLSPPQCMLEYTHTLPSVCWIHTTLPCPVHGGIHIPPPSAWRDTPPSSPPRRPLQQTVRILLECILYQ